MPLGDAGPLGAVSDVSAFIGDVRVIGALGDAGVFGATYIGEP